MKVKLEEGYRHLYTLAEYDNAKALIECMKDYDATPKTEAETAACLIMEHEEGCLMEVLTAKAETIKNGAIRSYDHYGDNTGRMDVFISGVAETSTGFIKFAFCLSDLWELSSDNRDEIRRRIWRRMYKEV